MLIYIATATSLGIVGVLSFRASLYDAGAGGAGAGCQSLPFFTAGLMILVGLGYYVVARACRVSVLLLQGAITDGAVPRPLHAPASAFATVTGTRMELRARSDVVPTDAPCEKCAPPAPAAAAAPTGEIGEDFAPLRGHEPSGGRGMHRRGHSVSEPAAVAAPAEGEAPMEVVGGGPPGGEPPMEGVGGAPAGGDPAEFDDYGSDWLGDEWDDEEGAFSSPEPRGAVYERRVWSNVYGLGIGIFCMAYCMQFPTGYTNAVACTAMWLIALQEFSQARGLNVQRLPRGTKERTAAYYQSAVRNDVHTYVLMPGVLGLYAVVVALMWLYVSPPAGALYAVLNTVVPVAGPVAMRFVRKPADVAGAVELGAPIAGLISLCVVCTVFASDLECTSLIFAPHLAPPTPPKAQGGGAPGWFPNHGAGLDTEAYEDYWAAQGEQAPASGGGYVGGGAGLVVLPSIAMILTPLAGIFATVAITVAYISRRTIDVAVGFLVMAVAVDGWSQAQLPGAPEAQSAAHGGWNASGVATPLGGGGMPALRKGVFASEVALAAIVAVGLAVYRAKAEERDAEPVPLDAEPGQARVASV